MAKALNDDLTEMLPQALAIQKKKFLIAINKLDPADAAAGSFSQADEQLVEEVTMGLDKLHGKRPSSKTWTDSVATLCVKDTLQKHAVFQLPIYLSCADVVCKHFSEKPLTMTNNEYIILEYVLTHARQFGDPTKNIFQIEATTDRVPEISFVNCLSLQVRLGSGKISESLQHRITQSKQLITALREHYDETKFQLLNAQITSFTLIILRRLIKDDEIEDEIEDNLPSICLVIEAYQNSDDEITKRNIHDTCIKYIEWHEMPLPGLFFKVVDLYGIEPGELWDHLLYVNKRSICYALIILATEYYDKYQLSKADPSQNQRWFAYCRMFSDDYHRRLSYKNTRISSVLKALLEKEGVNEHMFMYPNLTYKIWASRKAAELYHKIKK